MEKEVLRAIEGIEIYPVVSLVVFLVFFIGVIIWTFKKDKQFMAKMSNLPLEKNNGNSNWKDENK